MEQQAPRRAPRLFDRIRAELRLRHYSPATEKAYVAWTRRLVRFHRRHPRELGAEEIKQFLDALVLRLGYAFRISAAPGVRAAEILRHRKPILSTLSVLTYDNPERSSGPSY